MVKVEWWNVTVEGSHAAYLKSVVWADAKGFHIVDDPLACKYRISVQ
jgi:hypothetical protein